MRLLNVHGRLQNRNVTKYLMKWNKGSRTKIQTAVKKFLKPYWKDQVVYEEFPVYGTRLKVDILNATKKIAIEVQGRQHTEFNKFFHNNSRLEYLKSIKRDVQKRNWLEANDFKVIEIDETEITSLSKTFFERKFKIGL